MASEPRATMGRMQAMCGRATAEAQMCSSSPVWGLPGCPGWFSTGWAGPKGSTLDWPSSLGKACQVQGLKVSARDKGTEGDPRGEQLICPTADRGKRSTRVLGGLWRSGDAFSRTVKRRAHTAEKEYGEFVFRHVPFYRRTFKELGMVVHTGGWGRRFPSSRPAWQFGKTVSK